jgi:hypothetical protein
MHGRGQRPAATVRTIFMPTSYDPVKVIPATSSDSTSAAPISLPAPLT